MKPENFILLSLVVGLGIVVYWQNERDKQVSKSLKLFFVGTGVMLSSIIALFILAFWRLSYGIGN